MDEDVIISEESQRTSGDDAQSMNITAGKAVSEAARTTLGPKGMDKMLVGCPLPEIESEQE